MGTFFVLFLVVPAVSRLFETDRNAELPPTQVTVDFQVDRTPFADDDAKVAHYVDDLAAAFEARLIASRSWPADVRVSGSIEGHCSHCSPVDTAHLQVRSTHHFSPDAVRLALGSGSVTFARVTDPAPHPCASGDPAHIQIVPSAVGESGCLLTDQYRPHLVHGDVAMDDLCDMDAPTSLESEAALFTFSGDDATWLEQWAGQHTNAELAMMVDGLAVGVVRNSQILPGRNTIPLPGFKVQSQINCGLTTVLKSAQRATLLDSNITVR